MIRLLLRLFKITDFEPNETVSILKQQLEYERQKNKELTDTLLNIFKPKLIESPLQEVQPLINTGGIFARRRAALEAKDREEAKILRNSTNLGKPDDAIKNKEIEILEKELGVEAEKVSEA